MSFPNPSCLWCGEGFSPKHRIDDYFLTRVANNSFTEVVEPSTRGGYTQVKDFVAIVKP